MKANRPEASSSAVREFMRRQRRADTKPERRLRSALHRRGVRFRINVGALSGRPDIVLVRARVAIFVDGCFWHGCPTHHVKPKANASFWARKVRENFARDRAVDQLLEHEGWLVRRVWEHEDPEAVADELTQLWSASRRSPILLSPASDELGTGRR